jgi:hypothetical protein
MEDKKFQDESDSSEKAKPSRSSSKEERELKAFEQVVEEGNQLLGLPPLPPWDD